jgi:hypothetical protein
VGLDSHLAGNCSRDPDRDFLACEVSEGAAVVRDCAVWVAFLGGLCGARLASALDRQLVFHTLGGEALIEECIPQNIAGWQLDWRHEVVSERGLFACREAHDVRG